MTVRMDVSMEVAAQRQTQTASRYYDNGQGLQLARSCPPCLRRKSLQPLIPMHCFCAEAAPVHTISRGIATAETRRQNAASYVIFGKSVDCEE